jgi:hypothetical protein
MNLLFEALILLTFYYPQPIYPKGVSMNTSKFRVLKYIVSISFILISNVLLAHNKVVVVALGDDTKPLHNIVTVAKKNGDFTSPIDAIASITNANEDNRYLVVIGPGEYDLGDQALKLKSWVDVVGSGREVTTLTRSSSNGNYFDGAVVNMVGVNHTSFSDLNILNESTGLGIFIEHSNESDIKNVRINVFYGGTYNAGLIANKSRLLTSDLKINVFNNNGAATGAALVGGAKLGITDSTITVNGTGVNGGIGVTASSNSDSMRISNSTINASKVSVDAKSGTGEAETYISDTILTGFVLGDPKCSFVFYKTGEAFDSNCLAPIIIVPSP